MLPRGDDMVEKPRSPVTIREVAKEAGVSVGTVSRFLNSPESVRARTLNKVRHAIDKLDYIPDRRAQIMRRRKTLTIGFVVDDIANPLHAMTFKAANAIVRKSGFYLFLVNTAGSAEEEASAINMLQNGGADGVILTINSERDPRTIKQLEDLKIPAVLLDRELPIVADGIMTDHATGMHQATKYLLELGHRHIAFISGSEDSRPGRERMKGYRSAFEEAQLPVPQDLVRIGSLSVDHGFRAAASLLEAKPRPTAMIAAGNRILVGALRVIRQLNVQVPDELSLITCDQTDGATLFQVSITFIERDIEEIGELAASMLLERLEEDRAEARVVTIPTRLIIGSSCAAPKQKA